MFWKFNLLTSHIDTLLEKEDVTLTEILDEDDVLQETKAQNRKLLEFLTKKENIEELVNLITREPSDEVDEKSRYKFPNTACELLTSDVGPITDKLSEDEELLTKVYVFLESEGPLNPLLASFFSKVIGLLITRKAQVMLEFLKGREDFVGHLLRHMGTSAIMDLLLRLITCIDSTELRQNCINWLDDQKVIQKLVKMIHPSQSEEKHCNASQSLCDIIRLSREQMSSMQIEPLESDPLLNSIESEAVISDLLGNMLDGEKDESVITNGLSVIQTLLEFKKMGIEGLNEPTSQQDQERMNQCIGNTIKAVLPRLKDLHQLLHQPPKQHYIVMPSTAGPLEPPLGNTRLQVARLAATLLQFNNNQINSELCKLATVDVLLDLFFKYVWNNFLHLQVETCVFAILRMVPNAEPEMSSGQNLEDGDSQPINLSLISTMLSEWKLIQRILDAWDENELQQSRPEGQRKGYMGHLTKIANSLVESLDKGSNTELLKSSMQALPEDVQKKWEAFVSGSLAEMNKTNTVELVGGQLLQSSSEDDDAEFNHIPLPPGAAMQQAFSDYQLQQMTSNFIDQFGFNEEEFTEQEGIDAPFGDRISSIDFSIGSKQENDPNAASLFEARCNERSQQFDDTDSDEELWEEREIQFSVSNKISPAQPHNTTSQRNTDSSSDSEDDLESPSVIRQAPSGSINEQQKQSNVTSSEKMDVDNTEWANFDDIPMESAPVAMDTASPWDSNAQVSPTNNTSQAENNNWANFSSMRSSTPNQEDSSPSSPNQHRQQSSGENNNENWADFTSFDSMQTNSSDQGPQSSVAMDTVESSIAISGRSAAYLVSSAPADMSQEVSKSNNSPTKESLSRIDNHGESPVSNATDSTNIGKPTNVSPTDETSFLSSTGLMKNVEQPAGDSTGPSTKQSDQTNTSIDQVTDMAKVEEARAKAKEALEEFRAAAGGSEPGKGPI